MSSYPPPNSGKWTTGLCGCFEDCGTCVCGYCCPCILVGRYIEIIDQGATSCLEGGAIFLCLAFWTGCGCIYTCGYRGRLRQKFGLPASPCGDFCTECWCYGCSVCQVYRELRNRDIDPKLGWAGAQKVWDQPWQAPLQQHMGR